MMNTMYCCIYLFISELATGLKIMIHDSYPYVDLSAELIVVFILRLTKQGSLQHITVISLNHTWFIHIHKIRRNGIHTELNLRAHAHWPYTHVRTQYMHTYHACVHPGMHIPWFGFDALIQWSAYNAQRNWEIVVRRAGIELTTCNLR